MTAGTMSAGRLVTARSFDQVAAKSARQSAPATVQ